MTPHALPPAIQSSAHVLAELDSKILSLKLQLERYEAEADISAAFDESLKNEPQRKAQKHRLLIASADYQMAQQQLVTLSKERALLQADLDLLRNELRLLQMTVPLTEAPQVSAGNHYVFKFNPKGEHPWEIRSLYDPLQGFIPGLPELVGKALQNPIGTHLVEVSVSARIIRSIPNE